MVLGEKNLMATLPQLKSELLKEIKDYLESKGVKGEDLKQRIKELKEKCPPDLRYNLLKLRDYYEIKKPGRRVQA